jgi:hypothetical protein
MKRLALLIALFIVLLPGCRGGLGPDAEPDVGGKALRTALEAWSSGKSQGDLEKGNPSIIMNEDDWRMGKRLVEFTVEDSAMAGRQVRCHVRIKLQDKDGKTVDQRATYVIDTTPRIVIVRDSFAS